MGPIQVYEFRHILLRNSKNEYHPDTIEKQWRNNISILSFLGYERLRLVEYEQPFDVFDIQFQNVALQISQSWSDFFSLCNGENCSLMTCLIARAAIMARAIRSDVSWEGEFITEKDGKIEEMTTIWKSLELFDWQIIEEFQIGELNTIISVVEEDTQICIKRLMDKYSTIPDSQFCWLNMANAYYVGGCFQYARGSQEECVGSRSTVLGTLSNVGTTGRCRYQKRYQIPAGGNYFCKCRFLVEPKLECSCISNASIDLWRSKEEDIETRIKLDHRGILMTAKYKGIKVLVLGATGCGAFGHDPTVEVRLWKESLALFKGIFQEVCFAILGEPNFTIFHQELTNNF